MDIYPVSNADYQTWVAGAKIKELPRHWEAKSDEEALVTEVMELLTIVDVTYDNASSYSAQLDKRIPCIKEWRKTGGIIKGSYLEGVLNENRLNYLIKNRLRKSFDYYCLTDIFRALDRAHASPVDRARELSFALDRAWNRAIELDRDIARDLALARTRDLERYIELSCELALDRALDFVKELANELALACRLAVSSEFSHASNLSRDCELARELARSRILKSGKLVNYFDTARNAIIIIEKELKEGWTREARMRTFELGEALVDALVALLEIRPRRVPEDLLKALRQPGLLTPVNEFPPNDLGICGLVGNVWEWTSTTNEKGEHLICGCAWTEEKYDPDKEEWRPPEWRDINLGFRCVCDWDKICDVKEPGDLLKEPEGEVEVKAEAEEEGGS